MNGARSAPSEPGKSPGPPVPSMQLKDASTL
jgi:hypothetical protein